jgi:hypothetical protein
LLLFSLPLLADEEETHDIDFEGLQPPWFTGPLIAPSGYTVKPGHFLLQPFFDAYVFVGAYNSKWKSGSMPNFYNINLRTRLKAGITSWLDVVSSKLWHLYGIHYFEARFYSGYRIGTPASLCGLSVYGGGPGTHGTIYPGNIFFADIALQYNLSLNWAFACDIFYRRQDRNRFSGKTVSPAGLPSSEQFSLAPALEYNFSKDLGLIGGVWFTAAGRNTPQFINGLFSLNAYF